MDGDGDWNFIALSLITFLVFFGLCYSFAKHHGKKPTNEEHRRGFEVKLNARPPAGGESEEASDGREG